MDSANTRNCSLHYLLDPYRVTSRGEEARITIPQEVAIDRLHNHFVDASVSVGLRTRGGFKAYQALLGCLVRQTVTEL